MLKQGRKNRKNLPQKFHSLISYSTLSYYILGGVYGPSKGQTLLRAGAGQTCSGQRLLTQPAYRLAKGTHHLVTLCVFRTLGTLAMFSVVVYISLEKIGAGLGSIWVLRALTSLISLPAKNYIALKRQAISSVCVCINIDIYLAPQKGGTRNPIIVLPAGPWNAFFCSLDICVHLHVIHIYTHTYMLQVLIVLYRFLYRFMYMFFPRICSGNYRKTYREN